MPAKVSPLELNSQTVTSLLRIRLTQIDKALQEHLDNSCPTFDQPEHPYCDLNDDDRDLVDKLWGLLEWKASNTFIDKNGELEELMGPDMKRLSRHKHECGHRMTGQAVVVESA